MSVCLTIVLQEDMSYREYVIGNDMFYWKVYLMGGHVFQRTFFIGVLVLLEDLSFCRSCFMGEHVFWEDMSFHCRTYL